MANTHSLSIRNYISFILCTKHEIWKKGFAILLSMTQEHGLILIMFYEKKNNLLRHISVHCSIRNASFKQFWKRTASSSVDTENVKNRWNECRKLLFRWNLIKPSPKQSACWKELKDTIHKSMITTIANYILSLFLPTENYNFIHFICLWGENWSVSIISCTYVGFKMKSMFVPFVQQLVVKLFAKC